MPVFKQIEIELTAQELLSPPPTPSLVEMDDVSAFNALLDAAQWDAAAPGAANGEFEARRKSTDAVAPEDSVEIELTAEQIDAFLEDEPSV
jgi:hypothetical protein